MSDSDKRREALLWWLSWGVVSASVLLILVAIRPTPPTQSLGLYYSLPEADAIVDRDQEAVRYDDKPDVKRALELAQNRNLAQLGRMPPEWDSAAERDELQALGQKLSKSARELRAAQARVAEDAMTSLLGGKSQQEAEKALGASIAKLRQYRLASGPHLRAPAFVIRTFYKARFNQVLGLAPTAGLTKVEQLAHFGWPAFHAEGTSAVQRLAMLDAYQQLDGEHAQALRGQLLFQAGSPSKSAIVYEHLYDSTGNLRYRNHALFMRERLREASDSP